MRKKIVAGNWKMNTSVEEGVQLAKEIVLSEIPDDVAIIIAPPYTHLAPIAQIVKDNEKVSLSAQNCHEKESGAYTGEISPKTLVELGVEFVILGHSERRTYFHEDDTDIFYKMRTALDNGLKVILCVGEKLEQREVGDHFKVVQKQLEKTICKFNTKEAESIVIAYEPVWAIGTGKTATSGQAEEMHGFIREVIANNFDNKFSEGIEILYGGSCKPNNAKEIFAQHNVDGGLIGGASLKSVDFLAIAGSF